MKDLRTLYAGAVAYVRETVWAIDARAGDAMIGLLVDAAADGGARLSREQMRARLGRKRTGRPDVLFVREDGEIVAAVGRGQPLAAVTAGQAPGSLVAVLAVHGVILQRGAGYDFFDSVGTSIERLTTRFRLVLADPAVKAIVLDVDSPGGSVYGVPELADEIRAARGGRKPIEAVSNSLMASAAYYIGSAADKVWTTPSGETGSIGVYAAHLDLSKYLEQMGAKVTLVQYGENKTLGNPFQPLSTAAMADMQKRVDEYGRQFDRAVARFRGVTTDVVRQRFGQGLVFGAREAAQLGLTDGVATLDEVVGRLARPRTASAPSEAAASQPAPAHDAQAASLHAAALAGFYAAEREAAAGRARIM